jgi:SPP1 family predicted phage head-tail adaptor
MRDQVVIQSRTIAQDGYGAPVPTWSDVGDPVWANVEPLTGREAWQAQQVRPDLTHRVTMRFYSGLTTKHRLKIGSRILNIESAVDVESRGREHVLMCKEEV